jgi:predicted Zn-ribbon and HTH transcriptional regulator
VRREMSADNWTECPKCKNESLQKQGASETPLREDYEFYLEGFTLYIIYSCSCTDCGFEFKYKNQIEIGE